VWRLFEKKAQPSSGYFAKNLVTKTKRKIGEGGTGKELKLGTKSSTYRTKRAARNEGKGGLGKRGRNFRYGSLCGLRGKIEF